jgi:hypothetical protein
LIMGFASAYLETRAIFPELIKEAPDKQTGIIVVVPACNESGLNSLLNSLASCSEPDCKVEVLVFVNAPPKADIETLHNNRNTIAGLHRWRIENISCYFRLFAVEADTSSVSGWGVGLARKTGMDEAVRRFDKIGRSDGVIVSLDADCQVESNYFTALCDELLKRKDRSACSVYFEHPLSGKEYPEHNYRSVTLYELHLRYYLQGISYSGFPYVFHTVGSALAVKALPYIKVGGMNRRQAGEDFYFIQKLVPGGGYCSLNSTTVYPSPRASGRVPFGTGATVMKMVMNNQKSLLSYNFLAFKDLKAFFNMIEQVFNCKYYNESYQYYKLPASVQSFISETEWRERIKEIKGNTSGLQSFQKRFFNWFNMFKIVKYLNHVHLHYYRKYSVEEAACDLLESTGIKFTSKNPAELLLVYRKLEKGRY